jgi:hypothetical protein
MLELALPIGPVSLRFELGLEGYFPLHPAPFRNFRWGAAQRVSLRFTEILLFQPGRFEARILAQAIAAKPKRLPLRSRSADFRNTSILLEGDDFNKAIRLFNVILSPLSSGI